MRQKWMRLGLWLLVIAWMAVIFAFSAQSGEASSQTSSRVVRWLLERLDGGFATLSPQEQLARMRAWSFAVRKLAHFSEFALLGTLAFCVSFQRLPGRRAFFAAWGLAVAWAVADEVHQAFVPGRACEVLDMVIDAAGALAGTAFAAGCQALVQRHKRQ